jgi:predicted DCC family thiol-disulfide oxidoreductase YuxK
VRGRSVVLFDETCALCLRQVRRLRRLDWLRRLEFVPISSACAEVVAPGVDREALLTAMHVVTPKGRCRRGARAIRHVSLQVPLLWPLGMVMLFPGVIWFVDLLYGTVARNRRHFG